MFCDSDHMDEAFMHARLADVQPLPLTTGAICQKSPMLRKGIPPKGASLCMIVWQTESMQSMQAMFATGSLSHAMRLATLMSSARKENS
jgi:hypothetical protein